MGVGLDSETCELPNARELLVAHTRSSVKVLLDEQVESALGRTVEWKSEQAMTNGHHRSKVGKDGFHLVFNPEGTVKLRSLFQLPRRRLSARSLRMSLGTSFDGPK